MRLPGMAAMATAIAFASACAHPQPANAPTQSAAASPGANATGAAGPSAARPAPPEPTLVVEPGGALGLDPTEGEILVRTEVLRGHPVGARVGPLFAFWPGWGATLRAISPDPVAELDWIDIVGPTDANGERMLGFVRANAADLSADAAIDGRLVALQARSAEPAESHVDPGLTAAAAQLDGVLRVVFRPQPGYVAAAAAVRGPVLSHRLARARIEPPAGGPLEAVRANVPHPHLGLPLVPDAIERLHARVNALPNGDADADATGDCDDPGEAVKAAAALRDAIARENSPLVRMLTHGVLDAIAVTAEGPAVKVQVHATRDQLETVVTLLTAMAPRAATGR
jgi:hypothetical protein